MKNLTLKFKIITIFLIPIITIVYFSFYFIDAKVKNLDDSSMYKLSAKITKSFSDLLLNLQVERGLSAGYLVSTPTPQMKESLLKQHKQTDLSKEIVINYIKDKSFIKKLIHERIGKKNKLNTSLLRAELKKLSEIREKILKKQITFQEEMQYYTNINTALIKSVENLSLLLRQRNLDSDLIPIVQNLKEYAGLERACIYNKLLSQDNSETCYKKVKLLQEKQKDEKTAYMLNATDLSIELYEQVFKNSNEVKINLLRKRFFDKTLTVSDADIWFKESSYRINQLEKISDILLQRAITLANHFHEEALSSLYITAIVWILFLFSLSFLFFILLKMIKKEEKHTHDLSIAACTFNSYEAITITDPEGKILKINDGFTRITGYTPQEVIGKNPRVLKSQKHQEKFYTKMWNDINTTGRWSSNIYNKRKNGEIYLERLTITAIKNELGEVTNYIGQFLDISELQNAQNKALHQANHDFLTGLANRKLLMRRLKEEFVKAKQHDFLHAFLFVDLDDFKHINDSYGHTVGDILIKEVANRLNDIIDQKDFLARLSGDEFAIILLNVDKEETVATHKIHTICTKVLETLEQDFHINNKVVHISSSIGVKLFPDEERNSEDVILHADTAMYKAKELGKNQCVFFNKELEQNLKRLSILEEEIKAGLKNNEFVLYYQPKVHIKSGKICGAELLSRWNHPTKGLLYPDEYLQTVQNLGLISEFTTLALKAATKFLAQNKSTFFGSLAININSKEIFHPDFGDKIIELVSDYGINPSKLELEITEEELIQNFDVAVSKMKKLQDFGLQFSIDDFGKGYSSITYLQQLPVNTLKIDKEFFNKIEDQANKELVKTIIDIAKIFNMSVVVEGIETQEQLSFLQTTKADSYQGFIFSKAIQEDDFLKLLDK
jgi:diguanylate cyclase (GGDEF)-like protein/PAS domain S-box-containing protein